MKGFTLLASGPRQRHAFALVEVVIALAITAFCVLTILSLLPVGASTAWESRRATRASYLCEQIVSDLRSTPFTNASIECLTNGGLGPLPSFSMAIAGTNYLACDAQDNVLFAATPGQYASGVASPSVNYLVQVAILPSAITNLSSVSVEVSAPAQGALGSRARYGFQTMIGNRQ